MSFISSGGLLTPPLVLTRVALDASDLLASLSHCTFLSQVETTSAHMESKPESFRDPYDSTSSTYLSTEYLELLDLTDLV